VEGSGHDLFSGIIPALSDEQGKPRRPQTGITAEANM
jgi:hypothetical protein